MYTSINFRKQFVCAANKMKPGGGGGRKEKRGGINARGDYQSAGINQTGREG